MTSFTFYDFFPGMNIKKVTNKGGSGEWSGGIFLISSWKWMELLVLTNIQAISMLVCLLLNDMGSWCVIIQLSIILVWINCSSGKRCFLSLKSLLPSQFSTYKHWTRFNVKRKQVWIEVYGYTTCTSVIFFI